MLFGLVGLILILKARFNEKISIIYSAIAIFLPEILLLIIATFTGNFLTLFESEIVLSDAMKVSQSIFIMLIIFAIGALIVFGSSDVENRNIVYFALPLFTVLTNLFSIYRVVYYWYPITTHSNVQFYLLYLQQQLLMGGVWFTIPFEFIFWCIDLGVLLVAVLYGFRRIAHSEMEQKRKILEMESIKKDPFNYPNIKPGEFDEIYLDDEEKEHEEA